jgi:hypothetical protein
MTEIIYIPNIENYTQEIVNGELILTPKPDYMTQKQNITESIIDYKSINENGMNLFEILTDLSNAIGVDLFQEKDLKLYIPGLLHGFPKHCNLYFMISTVYKKKVPKWFAHKYNEVDMERWRERIEA